MRSPVNSLLQIRIVEDDIRALSTKFEGNVLQVALRGSLHDLPADKSASGESNLIDIHVLGDGCSDGVSVAGDDVDDTWWESGLLDKSAHADGGEGRVLGWF